MTANPLEQIRRLIDTPALSATNAAARLPVDHAAPPARPAFTPPANSASNAPAGAELDEFLRTVLPPNGPVYFAASLVRDKGMRHIAARSIEELARHVQSLDAATHDSYFALATFNREWVTDAHGKQRQRVRDNVAVLQACWLDIDVGTEKAASGDGYATIKDALSSLVGFCQQLTIAPTYIVSSGHGAHAYFAFTQSLALAEWQFAADALKRACALAGLRADPSRTADAASILRPIGTLNWKDQSEPKPVTVLKRGAVIDFSQFTKAIANLESQLRGGRSLTLPSLLGDMASNDDLMAGVSGSIAWFHALGPSAKLRIIDDACAAVSEQHWSQYDVWTSLIAAVRSLDDIDEESRLALLEKHSSRSPKWAADGWNTDRLREKFRSFDGSGSVRRIFELAEAHGWTHRQCGILIPFGADDRDSAEKHFAANYIYVAEQSAYLDVRTRQLISPASLDESQSWLTQRLRTTPRGILRTSSRSLRADSLGYHPGEPETYTDGARMLANLYVPWSPQDLQPAAAELELWRWLIDDHFFSKAVDTPARDYFLNALAYPLQYPGRRVASVPLLIGEEYGSGKSTLLEHVPRLLYGERNVTVATQSEIESGFNDWLANAQIVCFPEIWLGAHREAEKLANRLKDVVTNPVLRVHPKGLKGYSQPNRATILATSNYENAVSLREGDRRWGVHVTSAPKMREVDAKALYQFLESDRAAGVLRHIFKQRSLAGFNADGEPPLTNGKKIVITASRSPAHAELVEAFEHKEDPFDRDVFVMEDVRSLLARRGLDMHALSDHKLAALLRAKPICAEKLSGGQKYLKAVRPIPGELIARRYDGRYRVWALRNFSQWNDANAGAIARHIADGGPPLSAVHQPAHSLTPTDAGSHTAPTSMTGAQAMSALRARATPKSELP